MWDPSDDSLWIAVFAASTGEQETCAAGDKASWSPEGEWISFGHRGDLLVVPADGGDADVVLTSGSSRKASWTYLPAAAWAPDATMLAYARTETVLRIGASTTSLGIYDVSPGDTTTLLGSGVGSVWAWRP